MAENVINPVAVSSNVEGKDPKQVWRMFGPVLSKIIRFSAVLIGAGFFVVHSYIASVSGMFTFNISPSQYIAAGTNLLLAIMYYVILPVVVYGVLFSLVVGMLVVGGRFGITRSRRLRERWSSFYRWWLPTYRRRQLSLQRLWLAYQILAWLLLGLIVLALSFVYGVYYYPQSPRMFGGGMPARVILIFDAPQQDASPLYPVNPSNAIQSLPVDLLIELTDGVMIRDIQTGRVLIIKNDTVRAIVDIGSPAIVIPAPTSSLTPISAGVSLTPIP